MKKGRGSALINFYPFFRRKINNFFGRGGQKAPSFVQFVEYLVRTHNGGAYFRPMFDLCGFCSVEYDVIGKVETWANDLK